MSKFHISTQILQRNAYVFWKNLHYWRKFYTIAGRDGRDKFQVCGQRGPLAICVDFFLNLVEIYHSYVLGPGVVWTQGKCQQTVETQKRAHPWLQQSRVERRGKGVILPMSVLILKMSLPKMIILFDDYNGRHYPVEVKIIQLPKKLDGELTNQLATKISINALFWLKPGKLNRIPCIPQMLLEVKQI